MATGRMLQRRISVNKELPRLVQKVDEKLGAPHGAYAALLYTWCIPHLDVEGRMNGDPDVVKGQVVPRLAGVMPESIRTYLETAAELGLVVYYEAGGDLWLEFPAFKTSQPGLRAERETKSTIPPASEGRSIAGGTPAEVRRDAGDGPAEVEEEVEREVEDFSPPRAHARNGTWGPGPFLQVWERVTRKSGQTAGENLRTAADKIADAARIAGREDVEAYAAELIAKLPKVLDWCRRSGMGAPSFSIVTLCDDRHFSRCEDAVAGRFDPDKPVELDGGRGRAPVATGPPAKPNRPPMAHTLRYGDD
jgi:hypothetical protein